MIEHLVRITREFLYFINSKPAEIAHLVAKVYIMFFITRFLRCMRRKHQALSDFLDILVILVIKIKGSGQAMCFVQMICFCFESYFIKQFRPANTQQNK